MSAAEPDMLRRTRRSLHLHSLAGALLTVATAAGLGGWSATTEFAGAVVAPGRLVVASSVKKVQHPTGGVVRDVLVAEGDHVSEGQVLVRMDDTQARAGLDLVVTGLAEMLARQARLQAERDGEDRLDFSALDRLGLDPSEAERLQRGETRLFELRRATRDGQRSQLRERIGQLREEVQGLSGQVQAKTQELRLITDELAGVRDLWQKKLIPVQRVNALERDVARTDGEKNALVSAIAQAKGKITETELQILQIDQDLRSEVAKELRENQAKLAELQERRITAQDQLARVEVRAPQAGRVHELAIHTVGGVVGPGEQMMLIVPEDDRLTAELRIPPQQIDQVREGQAARLRFPAFDQRTTPEIEGHISLVSADVSQDAKSGAGFYAVRVAIDPGALAKIRGLKLVPGMPAEAFVQTAPRTVLSFLTKPLAEQVMRTFREK